MAFIICLQSNNVFVTIRGRVEEEIISREGGREGAKSAKELKQNYA
jgi:ribosomal protein S11